MFSREKKQDFFVCTSVKFINYKCNCFAVQQIYKNKEFRLGTMGDIYEYNKHNK